MENLNVNLKTINFQKKNKTKYISDLRVWRDLLSTNPKGKNDKSN